MKEGKCKFSKYALWTEAIRSPTLFPYVAGLGKYRHYTYFLRKSIRPRDLCIFPPTLCYHGTIWSWPCSSHGVNPNTPVAEGALTGRAITRISTTWRQSDMKYSIRVTNRCRVSTWSHDLRILVGLTANQLRVWRRLKSSVKRFSVYWSFRCEYGYSWKNSEKYLRCSAPSWHSLGIRPFDLQMQLNRVLSL